MLFLFCFFGNRRGSVPCRLSTDWPKSLHPYISRNYKPYIPWRNEYFLGAQSIYEFAVQSS